MIRGTKRKLDERSTLKADFLASIHNRFDIEVVDAQTGEVKNRAVAYNTVCNNLLDKLTTQSYGDGYGYSNYIHYGTGNGIPSKADTSLFSFSGAILTNNNYSSTEQHVDFLNGTISFTFKASIPPEAAVGSTITELGLAYNNTANTLCTHAMLQDMNGNTISITKSETDVINIYATVYFHFPMRDGIPAIWMPMSYSDGDAAQWLRGYEIMYHDDYRPRGVELTMDYVSLVQREMGSSYAKTTTLAQTASKDGIDFGTVRFPVDSSNHIHGAAAINIVNGTKQYFFLSALGGWWQGSDIAGEAIGTGDGSTTDFSTKFPFATGATIYVDGVPASAVVDSSALDHQNMGAYFMPVEANGDYFPPVTKRSDNRYTYKDTYGIYYNPLYDVGIDSFVQEYGTKVELSDDLDEWVEISNNKTGTISVPAEHRTKKFWKLTQLSTSSSRNQQGYIHTMTTNALTGKNIHFSTPPAAGAVITADYHTPYIAKDENNVFDFSLVLNFGEKNEE